MNLKKSYDAASVCMEGDRSGDECGASNKEEYTVGDNSDGGASKGGRKGGGEGVCSERETRTATEGEIGMGWMLPFLLLPKHVMSENLSLHQGKNELRVQLGIEGQAQKKQHYIGNICYKFSSK